MTLHRMKYLWLIALLFWMGCPQSPKTSKSSGRGLPIQIYTFQNLRMVHSPGDEAMVHFALQFKGGVENYPEHLQGIEKLALEMVVRSAPKGESRAQFLEKLNGLGASIGVEWQADYSLLTMDCPLEKWRPSLQLMLKWIMEPQFSPEVFAQVKDWAKWEAERHAKDPEQALTQRVMEKAFAGRPYQKYWGGTPSTLRAMTREEVQKYYSQFLLQTCRMSFLWTGKPERFDIEELLVGEWAKLAEGNCQTLTSPQVFPQQNTLHFAEGPGSQYRMWAVFPGAESFSAEAAALWIGMKILEARLPKAMEAHEAFAMNQQLGIWPMKQGLCGLYFLTVQPNRCAGATHQALREAWVQGFSAEELKQQQNKLVTGFWLSNESGRERLRLAATVNISSDPEKAIAYPQYLQDMTVEEVNRVMQKYATAITWVVSGPTKGVEEPYFLQSIRE